jgi:hypothetical protein
VLPDAVPTGAEIAISRMDALVGWILCRNYGHNAKQQLPDAAEMSGP